MKLLLFMALIIGCGTGPRGPAGVDGIDGIDGIDGVDGTDAPTPIDLAGRYYFKNGSEIELVKTASGNYYLYYQVIRTVNFDNGGTILPNLSGSPRPLENNKLRFSQNLTFNSTHAFEVDGSTKSISGSRKVSVIFSLDNRQLIVTIKVRSSNGLNVEVNRTIKSEVN